MLCGRSPRPAPTSSFFQGRPGILPSLGVENLELFLSLQLQTLPQSFPEGSQGLPLRQSPAPVPLTSPSPQFRGTDPPEHPQAVSPGAQGCVCLTQDRSRLRQQVLSAGTWAAEPTVQLPVDR